ncbi:MAG: DUF559 domain-containing protein [Caulobacteraceae bacterium]
MPPHDLLTACARELRRSQTDCERKLRAVLRGRKLSGFKFRRQQPVAGYIADFLCLEAKLIVELDGGQHADRAEYDATRTQVLENAVITPLPAAEGIEPCLKRPSIR